jgi:hypothetical protein
VHIQRDQPSIWATVDPYPTRKHDLRQYGRVVLLLKGTRTGDCRWRPRRAPVTYVSRCLPKPLQERTYRVESAEAGGSEWIFVVLTYHPPDL